MQLLDHHHPVFSTSYADVLKRIDEIDPVRYGATRNFLNGAVTYLSPYISRGIVSTKFILAEVLNRGFKPHQIEKFIQELAWRDYWQQIWIVKGNAINESLKHEQKPITNYAISKAILDANTGINALDDGVSSLYETGYMHNHLRMYVAALACNIGQSHWKAPAQWMYFHLLDADWASNALSWQWVSGANANKKYVANQDNINKFCFTKQSGTFLDVAYEEFAVMDIPEALRHTTNLDLTTPLPTITAIEINEALPTCIYNFYNLDPLWKKDILANRILLLEPSHFNQYPISQKTLDFIISFSKENIPNIQIYTGEFNSLKSEHSTRTVFYKEHPLNEHYVGIEDSRDWMFNVQGYYPSFFSFWKKCKKQLHY